MVGTPVLVLSCKGKPCIYTIYITYGYTGICISTLPTQHTMLIYITCSDRVTVNVDDDSDDDMDNGHCRVMQTARPSKNALLNT